MSMGGVGGGTTGGRPSNPSLRGQGDALSDKDRKELAEYRAMHDNAEVTDATVRLEDGTYKLRSDMSDEDAKNMGAAVTREQFERYMNDFIPHENKLIGSLGKTFEGHDPRNDAWVKADQSRAALERMRSRYGVSITGSQKASEWRSFDSSKQLGGLSAVNAARQASEDRDYNLRGSLLNLGNNLQSSATSGLTEASVNAQNRENAHRQATSQHKAQKQQQMASTVGTIATIGAIAF